MKTDTQVAAGLLGILLVAVLGLVYYLGGYLIAKYTGGAAVPWLYLSLVLAPVGFLALIDFSR